MAGMMPEGMNPADEAFWATRMQQGGQAADLMTGDPTGVGQPIDAGVGVLNPPGGMGAMHQMPDGSMMPGAEHPGGGGEGGGVLADVMAYLRSLGMGGGGGR